MRIVFLDSFTADQGQGIGAWPGLESLGSVTLHERTAGLSLSELCKDADAIITNKAIVSAELMKSLQPRLRYVGVSATGTNIVDAAAARALGIAVTNVPAYSTESVAQLTIALMLQLYLDVSGHDTAVKQGRWASCPDFSFFLHTLPELTGKTMVIVGMGTIGGAVARIATAFGMRIIAAAVPGRPRQPDRMPLSEALPQADVVSLHCPLSTQTEGLVDAGFLAQMKPGALLINTARGGLVNESALAAAIVEGRIGGAGLDVLSKEPPPADNPLLRVGNTGKGRLVITPHIAWGSEPARTRLRHETVQNLAAFARGERRNRVD